MLLAVCREFDVGAADEVMAGIAVGFAGGIGGTGSVCGAVVGAVMAIGRQLGRGTTMADALARMEVAGEFRRRFEAEMGSITCRELTGLDLTVADGRQKLLASDVGQRVCFPAVGTAYRLVVELLHEPARSPA